MPPLGAKYSRIFDRIPNKCVTPHVFFDLEQIAKKDDLSVYALFDPEFGEKPEDWTGLKEKSFCINFENDHFNYLVLSIANHDRNDTILSQIDIDVNADHCLEGETPSAK